MPKPDVVALTGGYRRTPILQVGADIYCDTALIADELDELAPSPPLHRGECAAANLALAQWADSNLFIAAVSLIFQPSVAGKLFTSPQELKAFADDRTQLRKGGTSRRPSVSEAKALLDVFLGRLNAQLADGRDHLFGREALLADFSVYHPLWFLRGPLPQLLGGHEHVVAWMSRMAAIGHGVSSEITGAEAISIARDTTPVSSAAVCDDDTMRVADRVEVMPTDYGLDPATGELVVCNAREIAIRRVDPRAGEVMVHFPRVFYQIRKVATDTAP